MLFDRRDGRALRGGATFPLRNRLYRLAWLIVWTTCIRWTPRPLWAWRRWLLRLFGAQLTATSFVYGSARIWSPANLRMGAGSSIGPRVNVYAMATITIGDGAIVSQDAHLCAGTHDYEDPAFQLVARPVVIGARVWIAAEAFVGPGVTIGEGAVLGARAVATRDIARWTVAAGNPAQAIKPRTMRSR